MSKKEPQTFPQDVYVYVYVLSGELDGSTSGLDLLLRQRGDELGLDDHRLIGGHLSLSKHLEISKLCHINHRSRGFASVLINILGHETPQPIDVDGGHMRQSCLLVISLHTYLSKITRVELIH